MRVKGTTQECKGPAGGYFEGSGAALSVEGAGGTFTSELTQSSNDHCLAVDHDDLGNA